MKQLNYATLREAGYDGYILESAPEKVMQFGQGNFLRAFANYWFDLANERVGWNGKCVLVQPIVTGSTNKINAQEGLFTVLLRGMENGEKKDSRRVISSVSRAINPFEAQGYQDMMDLAASDDLEYVVSNTTEAGIVYDDACKMTDQPPASFPAKLTQVLYHRYKMGKSGLVILACELIDNNGKELLKCVEQYIDLWGLEEGFRAYCRNDCTFCSTLVDRIVPGRIRDAAELANVQEELGYEDALLDVGEVFGVWNIEGPAWLEDKLPFKAAGLNCPVVPDVIPYKKRKVRILNGAHTGMVLGAYLAGYDIVRDCMYDEAIAGYMNRMLYDEILPNLPLEREDLEAFAATVKDRFSNPFVDHALMSISLNSTSKWKARNLPSLLDYVKANGKLPVCLTMSLAAYIAFYTSDIQELTEEGLVCRRPKGNTYTCSDDRWVLEFYYDHRNDGEADLVHAVLSDRRMWGEDLTAVTGLGDAVTKALKKIRTEGAAAAYASCL